MATDAAWSRGYARQAAADFDRYGRLEAADPGSDPVEPCHRLHFLQMACEKLVKAHLHGVGSVSDAVRRSHAYVAGTLPVVLRQEAMRVGMPAKAARQVQLNARRLAREIELLSPAVDRDGQRPDNCEYPWEDADGNLHVPLDWSFTPVSLLEAPGGRTFLKLLRGAINSLL